MVLPAAAVMAASRIVRLPEAAVATQRKMITNPVTAMAAMAVEAVEVVEATAALVELEVVTNPVATAVAPATRVVLIAKLEGIMKWSPKRIRSLSRA